MEVVPTGDGDDDDDVIWFRCPQCQGFLPKLSGASEPEPEAADTPPDPSVGEASGSAGPATDEMRWDSPADMMAEQESADQSGSSGSPFLPEDDAPPVDDLDLVAEDVAEEPDGENTTESADSPEPIAEYAALLADAEVDAATPYRPWGAYEVGQCVHHLAWDDCGVVVAKEDLPGGRKVVKCYFEDAGVVRLIEQAPR